MRFAYLVVVALLLATSARAGATTLRILTLPPNATIDSYSEQRAMTVNERGDVAVNAETDDGSRIVVWDRNGHRRLLDPPTDNLPNEPRVDGHRAGTGWAVMAADGRVFGVETFPFEGAYIGTEVRPYIWNGAKSQRFQRSRCGSAFGYLLPTASSVDGGVAMSTQPGSDSLAAATHTDATPPAAFVIRGRRCEALDSGRINSIDGVYASGYRVYEGSTLVSVHANPAHPFTFRAVRWTGPRASELGPGVLLGVNARGDCVGASRRLEIGAASPVHAIVWYGAHSTVLATHARNSVAYAINETGKTIVGSVWETGDMHAVRWRNGREEVLQTFLGMRSDLQLEIAYGITPDGSIYGVGRSHGKTVIFIMNVSP
jgi:hypothetical protein